VRAAKPEREVRLGLRGMLGDVARNASERAAGRDVAVDAEERKRLERIARLARELEAEMTALWQRRPRGGGPIG
jgi:predicted nucleotidyltransferase